MTNMDNPQRAMRPTKWRARDEYGEWVEGWYAMLHIPEFSEDYGVVGYKEEPHIFNDEPGYRSGPHWHAIDPATLDPVSEQLTFNFT